TEVLAVRQRDYEAVVSGTVDLGGTVAAPEARAALEVDRAVVRPDPTSLAGDQTTFAPDPTITVVGIEAPPPPPAPPPALDALSVIADVHIGHDAWVRRKDADVEFRGDVRIEKAPSVPWRVFGDITLPTGWFSFQGHRFTLRRGTMTFVG